MLAPGALEGVRVLSLLDGLGAYGARLLRGLGADVVLVEPSAGATYRLRPSRYVTDALLGEDDEAASLYFLHYCSGMRSVALDIAAPEARPTLERLIHASDVILDNGHLARLGFDLDALATAGSGRAIVSITPFGLDGPRSHWLGSDLVCQSMSGMLSYFGYRGERPARFGQEAASEMSGLAAALGALITVYGARHDRGGSVVDIAAQRVTALVSFQMANTSLYHQFGFLRPRRERTPGRPPELLETKDGFFTWSPWRKIPETLDLLEQYGLGEGLRELADQLGVSAFMTNERAISEARAFAARFTNQELVELMQPHEVMGLPIQDANQVLADPFLERRASFVEIEAPGLPAPLLDTGAPVRLSGAPYRTASRPPLLGEHTTEVLAELGIEATGSPAANERERR
jgi:crotonobetainyl-CoA:carnitine CoA-transferase CaiB-like acyl-CoA transferase